MKLFEGFSPESRIWIYQCNREFTNEEVIAIAEMCNNFTSAWSAHKEQLTAGSAIPYNRFIVFCVDENKAAASGCSIDKSIHVIREIEKKFNVFLLNRLLVASLHNDTVISSPLAKFIEQYRNGVYTDETLIFNNNISSLIELGTDWIIPVKNSWILNYIETEKA